MKAAKIQIALLALLLVFAGCSKKAPLTHKNAVEFLALVDKPGAEAEKEYRRFYQSRIKPSLKAYYPGVLERVFQYTGRTDYKPEELKGLIRLAFTEQLKNAKSPAVALEALKNLEATADGTMGPALADSVRAFTTPDRYQRICAAWTARHMTACLADIEKARLSDPRLAEQRMVDFRFFLLGLSEDRSEVLDIARVVWQETLGDVNDVNLEKIRNLLNGAFPGLF